MLAFSHPIAGHGDFGVPQFQARKFSQPLACLLYAGRPMEQSLWECIAQQAPPSPFWGWCFSHLHQFEVTTLQTQVSLVSLGRRGSPPSSLWLGDDDTLSVGFTPWTMPSSNACHFPLTSLLTCCR